jgi:type IV secretory pathway VirB4 component
MSWVTDIFSKVKLNVSQLIDEVVTTKEEEGELRNAASKIKSRLMQELSNAESEAEKRKKELIKTEMTGNLLQRSWRPVLMLLFGVVLIYHHFLASVFSLPTTELPAEFWELLKLGIGGYIIGRSGEKIAGSGAVQKLMKSKKPGS